MVSVINHHESMDYVVMACVFFPVVQTGSFVLCFKSGNGRVVFVYSTAATTYVVKTKVSDKCLSDENEC